MRNIIININQLYKSYESITALDGVSLSISSGEMFGLVGPDGAGKTTTLKILCGLINFDKGEVELLDQDINKAKKNIQKNIGYLSQSFSLYRDLSIDENIEFFAEIHNVKDYYNRRNELLEFTRLTKFRDRLADQLSGGMKQKLALACSLIHKPKILFLDEPTTGVDPVSRRDFWKILSSLRNDGITIVMSTPYLDEAERCSRVAMMNKGQIIALDSPSDIKDSINKNVLEIVCTPARNAYDVIKNNFRLDVQLFGDRINIVVDRSYREENAIEKLLTHNGVIVNSIRRIPPNLENIFIYKIKETG
ncbi:MAG: ABC transporter ATP-binding protein [Melioribacteraceae bacterium]|nr:ABC transporter ATP-binding protein [Melioribacteraceae bacterium]